MMKSTHAWIILLTILDLTGCALLTASVDAATLKNFRMGVSPEKTRIVFELDGPATYQVQTGDSGLTVNLDRLSFTQSQLLEILKSQGGLLKGVKTEARASGIKFQLATPPGTTIRHFSLKNPDRVVVDLLPIAPMKAASPPSLPTAQSQQKPAGTKTSLQTEKNQVTAAAPTEPALSSTDTLAHKAMPSAPAESQTEPENLARETAPSGGTGYLFYAIPFIILAAGGILLYMMARRSNRRIYEQDLQEEAVSDILEEHIDFRSLMKRGGSGPKEADSAHENQPVREAEAKPARTEMPPSITPKPEAREGSRAELSIENASLIWPVHLLDGGRVGRVMVVDDDAEITQMLEDYLVGAGFEVQALADSQRALEIYPDWRPDLLILDVKMPDLDGIQFAQEIGKEGNHQKIIFLSGQAERDSVAAVYGTELRSGQFEFMRKPISLHQIGGRVRDYFSSAQEILNLNLNHEADFEDQIEHLGPHQLVALHGFVWDHIFEISAELLGRRIESVYITDRMEPASNYMRRMGCTERRDYCIASKCIVSNPSCAANRLRAELEIMRQILMEFRSEYLNRIGRGIGAEDLRNPPKNRKRELRPTEAPRLSPLAEKNSKRPEVPAKQLLRRDTNERNR